MSEEWKVIDDYANYEVSSYGRVRSIDREYYDSLGRKFHKAGKILKLQEQTMCGYTQVMVTIRKKQKSHRIIVARLVAKAFVPNPNNFPVVNHKDENSLNNHADNLEWCTHKYNIHYKDLIERRAKHKSKQVDVFDNEMNYIETLPSSKAAAEKYNISKGMMSLYCNNVCHAKDYIFKFH